MANPQQPELRRSEQVPALNPDATKPEVEAQERDLRLRQGAADAGLGDAPSSDDGTDQDQPDPDRFAERFGVAADDE